MGYTRDQQRAINERGRNILVAAAAGSGKTRVLVERIIRQLVHKELSVDELLVVTFTNAAAAEMRERIEAALRERLRTEENAELSAWLERQAVLLTGADICTFHAFCQKIIRQNMDAIDVDPQFRLASEQELVLLKRDVLEDLLEQHYERPEQEGDLARWEEFLSFADDYGDDKGDETLYDAVLKLYNFCQSQPYPAEWLRRQQDDYAVAGNLFATKWFRALMPSMIQELARMIREYQQAVAGLVSDAVHADWQEAWNPYAGIVLDDVCKLEEIQKLLIHCEKSQEAGSFDAVREQAEKLNWTRLAGKAYKPLKELYPQVREAFDETRKKLKDQFKKQWAEKYLSESEAEILASITASRAAVRRYACLTADYMEALQAAKKERNILDFNDLEHYALEILCADPAKLMQAVPEYVPTEIARGMQEQFAAVMVDEYQDTNGVQEAILSLIARKNNRFMVGDIKQSIYRFRLADPYLFQAKYDSFPEQPEAAECNERIAMRQNFRSRAEVLAPINYIFDQVMTREAAEIEYDDRNRLYPGADYPEQEHTLKGPVELDILVQQPAGSVKNMPQLQEAGQDGGSAEELEGFALEAQHIAERIQQLMGEGRMVYDKEEKRYRLLELRDIAVLLRAVREKANILLETLRRNSIPAYADINGGYFEAAEVRLMLALLSVLDNARQDIPLAAVMASPIGGFSMEELVKIRLSAEQGDFYDGLLASFSPDSRLPHELAERAAWFQQELNAWRSYALSHSVPELLWMLYRETGYYDYVGSLKGGLLRQANLRMLADRAADYERTNYRGLFRFLRFLDDLQKRDTDLSAARTLGASENVVRIMSIHKSKGLEFPVVFVSDMGKGFNLRDAKDTFLMHQQLGIGLRLAERSQAGRQLYHTLPWQAVSDQIIREAKAEEMRVLYVAMTRAREKLILTGVLTEAKAERKKKSWGKYLHCREAQLPSACIRQAEDYLDWAALAVARHADGAPLREFVTGRSEEFVGLVLEPEAHFAVQVIPAAEVGRLPDGERCEDALLKAAAMCLPMPSTPEKERVESCLSWQYDLRGLDEVPAKLTVTELKHRFAGQDIEELSVDEQHLVTPATEEEKEKKRKFDWPRPQFLKEQSDTLSAAERGTIMHTAMQHFDIHGDTSFAEIQRQLLHMEQDGILLPGQKEVIYIKGMQAFADSAIGHRLCHAARVWRELPFSRMLPAKRFFPQVKEDGARVFTQGVIDVLFEEDDGGLVLLDYKTDRSADPFKALHRYRIQMELYCEAVKEILRRPVKECFLYLLQSGQLVQVPLDKYAVLRNK